MLSATGLTVALTLLASSASATDIEDVPAQAGASAVHTVAADGSTDFSSIQAAVDAASSGDTVVVKPGMYTEAVTIDKDLSLLGDGPRGEIVVAATADPARIDSRADTNRPHAILLTGESVTVAGLTVSTPDGTNGVVATAGAPVIERVSFVGPEETEVRASAHTHRLFTSLAFFGQTSPTVQDCEWDGYAAVRDGASVNFVGNTVNGDTISIDGPGESSVRDSVLHRGSISMSLKATGVIEGNEFDGDLGQVGVDTGATVEVRANTFRGSADDAAIWVEGPDVTAVVTGNTVAESRDGVRIARGATVVVDANTFDVTGMGLTVSATDAHIEGNTIRSDGAGIVIISGADPTVTANTIDAGRRAIVVDRHSDPIIEGNVICGDEVSLYVEDGAEPQIGDNELCEDA